ncbi:MULTISPECIES: GNAT family N-acetyltransferase [Aquimarina]|uniref:GNAT family N-acetyltransferase n=1 Tax=Aquimarina TaxID=290174 RepID=UPI0009F4CFED|nr:MULTISPECIES: GNAT family N-acetyltransferase [Aquimarina]
MHIVRPVQVSDIQNIYQLYKKIGKQSGGIIRVSSEITLDYIQDFVHKSISDGLILAIPHLEYEHQVIAEIHAYRIPISAFRHILTDLTIVVNPEFQGQGLGKLLFTSFLTKIKTSYPHILRVELFVRENNTNTIQFYEKLGFINEGKHHQKIKNLDHSIETPIHMAWFNPEYNNDLTH